MVDEILNHVSLFVYLKIKNKNNKFNMLLAGFEPENLNSIIFSVRSNGSYHLIKKI